LRITFSAQSVVTGGQGLRQIDDASFPLVYQGLLWANGPEEYHVFAAKLRAIAKKHAAPDFACLHPEWFSEEILPEAEFEKIDNTVCTFCGYFQQCHKGNVEFFTDVVFLQRSGSIHRQVNMEGTLRTAFDFRDSASGLAFSDPFTGFSRRAGEPRTLYAIAYDDMHDMLNDRFQGGDYAACVGYDLLTCQPLWPLDFILLSMMRDELTLDALLLRAERPPVRGNCLLVSDERFVESYLRLRQLELTNKRAELLKEDLHNLAGLLFAEGTLNDLRNRPFTPREDHPFERGSPSGLHILIRLFELMPSLLYLPTLDHVFPSLSSIMRELHEKTLPAHEFLDLGGAQRLLPRFPAVMFLPRGPTSVQFDLPGCKIIDVVDAEVDRPMLLFDALDFDVGLVRGWNLA
jgi:hypothetical protein